MMIEVISQAQYVNEDVLWTDTVSETFNKLEPALGEVACGGSWGIMMTTYLPDLLFSYPRLNGLFRAFYKSSFLVDVCISPRYWMF